MNYLIIFVMVVIFLMGFIFIDKIYYIVSPEDFQSEIDDKNKNEGKPEKALIFGRLTISMEIINLLEKRNISYDLIKDSKELNMSNSYYYLFAVDEDDLENLMICSIGKKMIGINKIISICNCSYNKKIYEDNQIAYFYGENLSAQQLISKLLA